MSKRNKAKAQQIAKVAAETKADPKDLARLPQDALQAIDDAIPDDGDLLGSDTQEAPQSETETSPSDLESSGSSESERADQTDVAPQSDESAGTQVLGETFPEAGSDIPPQETPQSPDEVETEEGHGDVQESGHEPSTDVVVKCERVLLGEHPVTGEPVFSDEQ